MAPKIDTDRRLDRLEAAVATLAQMAGRGRPEDLAARHPELGEIYLEQHLARRAATAESRS